MPGVARIGPKRPRHVFLAEWREFRGLTQRALGGRLNVTDMTISRWERQTALLSTSVLVAVSEALDCDPTDLFRHPTDPSVDALLRGQPESVKRDILARTLDAIRKAG